jgi:hypothetical protein
MPDCGDNSCLYATKRTGMRTNAGCRCDACPVCGIYIRPPHMRPHREWCSQPEWIPEHHLSNSGATAMNLKPSDRTPRPDPTQAQIECAHETYVFTEITVETYMQSRFFYVDFTCKVCGAVGRHIFQDTKITWPETSTPF